MADIPVGADANCSSCIKSAWAEISHNGGTDWYELPAIQIITKSFEEQTANQTRHSNSGEQFVSPCGASSRSAVYEIQFLFCEDDPLWWYIENNDLVKMRVKKGKNAPLSGYIEAFDAKVVEQGETWDNTSSDGQEVTVRFEATSPVVKTVPLHTGTPATPYFQTP